MGPQGFRLLAPMIVLRLWFWSLERALLGKKRTPVYIVMDEFQNVAEAIPDVVDTILSEARKYGLVLVMAHQHLHQYSERLLRSMFTNTLVKVFFPVADARDVAALSAVDADYAEEIRRALSGLPGGSALVSVAPDFGEPPAPPTVVRMDPPPRKRSSNIRPLTELLPRFNPPPEEPGEGDIVSKLNPVLRFLPRERLDPVEAWVLFHVYEATNGGEGEELRSNVLVRLGLPRNRADEARNALASRGFIEARREGNRWLVRYVRGLFEGLRAVAPSDEGYWLAREAVLHYFRHGYVVYPARQDPGLSARPDLVAIPFDPASMGLRYDRAIAVEVESCNELGTHPEQAVRNLLKHPRSVFQEIHVWAPAGCQRRLEELLARVENRLPLPVKAMPPMEAVEEEPEAGAPRGIHEEEQAGAGEAGGEAAGIPGEQRVEEPGGSPKREAPEASRPRSHAAEEATEDLRGLLEAQARLLAAMSQAAARLLEHQEKQSEKLDQLIDAVTRLNRLLEQLAQTTTQQPEAPEPTPETETGEPPRETETEPQGETGTAAETPETQEPQSCTEIQLDEPPGETACLPPQTAQRAQELKTRGHRLVRTGNHIYAEKHRRRTPIV